MKKYNKVFQSLTLILQFGLNMIVPIFLCTMFGVWLGKNIISPDYHPLLLWARWQDLPISLKWQKNLRTRGGR